ncbi:MAG: hypothetical protein KC910_22925 [Candidatus Eremiobacteraeota bacterium]|nr:hypothetical protein [Candidatus Eremiobacteraeota bacterium]
MTDFKALIRRLHENSVDFIVVGGFAGTVHGATRLTVDLDIVYSRTQENIENLTRALDGLDPYLRGAPPGLPFKFDAPTVLRGCNFTLTTAAGALDLLGVVTGGGAYEELVDHSELVDVFGCEIRCLSLSKLIEVKRAAGRPKDFEAIAELERLAEEQS